MKTKDQKYYAMDFIEEDGKTYVFLYDPNRNFVANREIHRLDVIEAIRLNGGNN